MLPETSGNSTRWGSDEGVEENVGFLSGLRNHFSNQECPASHLHDAVPEYKGVQDEDVLPDVDCTFPQVRHTEALTFIPQGLYILQDS